MVNMHVSAVLIALPVLLAPSMTKADWFHVIVSYTCDKGADQVRIDFRGAYNDAGEMILAEGGPDSWNPWKMVTHDGAGQIVTLETIRRTCGLSDGAYQVEIQPAPGSFNTQSHCGAHMSASATISKGGTVLAKVREFSHCQIDLPVVTTLTVKAGVPKPILVEIPGAQFYR